MTEPIKVGDIVWGNGGHALGLPYRAKVEDLRDDKAKLRPLQPALTAGSARSVYRKGPSLRARWVKAAYLMLVESDEH